MSCDYLAAHAIATVGASLSPEHRAHLQAVYDQPATLKPGEDRDSLARAGKALGLRLKASGATMPAHLDFNKPGSRTVIKFGRLAVVLSALTGESAGKIGLLAAPSLPTEPLEAQCERWDAWKDSDGEGEGDDDQAALRAFFGEDYGDIAAYLNGREDAAEACLGLLGEHRQSLVMNADMPPALRTMLSALPAKPKPSQLRAVLAGLCQTAGHPRCDECGQWAHVDDHRCPPKLTDLEDDRTQAMMKIGTHIPAQAFASLGIDGAGTGELMQTFLGGMGYLTDDREADEAFKPVVMKAQALRLLYQRAGVPIPPDLAQATDLELRYFPGQKKTRAFPTTWGGYADVFDALVKRGALGDPRTVNAGTPKLAADDVPVGAIAYNTKSKQVVMRIPRPAGETNVPYFVRLAGGEETEARWGPGWFGPDYDRKETYAVLRPALVDEAAPRWLPVELGAFDQATQDAITVARSKGQYAEQVRGLMRVAMRQEGQARRALVEEAVGIARAKGSWQSQSRPFAVAAAVAAGNGDEETARFIIETGIDDGEHAWASVYGEVAVALRRGERQPEMVGRLLRRGLECARVKDDGTFLGSLASNALSCGEVDIALDAMRAIRSEYGQMQQVQFSVRRFPLDRLPDLLAFAREVGKPEYPGGPTYWQVRAKSISEIATRADMPGREALAQEVYNLVTRQEQPDIRIAEALTNVAPLLTPEQRQDAIRRVGAIGQSGAVPPVESQMRGLTELAGALTGAEREQAAVAALERAVTLPTEKRGYENSRYEAIGDLYPFLPAERRREHFAGLVEAARTLDDSTARTSILRAMLPHTEGAEREAVMTVVRTLKQNTQEYVLGVLTPDEE